VTACCCLLLPPAAFGCLFWLPIAAKENDDVDGKCPAPAVISTAWWPALQISAGAIEKKNKQIMMIIVAGIVASFIEACRFE